MLRKKQGYELIPSNPPSAIPKSFSMTLFAGELARERMGKLGGVCLKLENGSFADGDECKIFSAKELEKDRVVTVRFNLQDPPPVIIGGYVENTIFNPATVNESDLKFPGKHVFDVSLNDPLLVLFVSSTYSSWVVYKRGNVDEKNL